MSLLNVQFNHPGAQKPFKEGKGYQIIGSEIIREWNNDRNHYRKFLLNKGLFINDIYDRQPKEADLFFWGEWEGNSIFDPFINSNYSILPNGVHKPFHSIAIRGQQNTDPFVFGDHFKYCVCKQKGKLCDLSTDSLILFGSVYPSLNKFYIDTVFIVKNATTSQSVRFNGGKDYSKIYKEETLEQLSEYLKAPQVNSNNKLYHSKTWWDNKGYFSFVPCKLYDCDNGFERLFLSLDSPIFNLSSYPSGKSFLKKCSLTPNELWEKITQIAFEQNFKLGIRFSEPPESNILGE